MNTQQFTLSLKFAKHWIARVSQLGLVSRHSLSLVGPSDQWSGSLTHGLTSINYSSEVALHAMGLRTVIPPLFLCSALLSWILWTFFSYEIIY